MNYNFGNLKENLKKIEKFLLSEYSQMNIGQASPIVLDGIKVLSYGSCVPLKNVASITIEDAKTLRVNSWDKSQMKEIEKAILSGNLGVSVSVDDAGIRVIFPQLTTENREKLVRVLKNKLEESRIKVRLEREKTWEEIQNQTRDGKMTEDEKFRSKDELQKIIDEANMNLDNIFKKREKEILGT